MFRNIRDIARVRIYVYRGIDACIAYIDDDCFHTFRFARVCTQLDLRVVALLHRPDQSESTEMPISQTSRFYKYINKEMNNKKIFFGKKKLNFKVLTVNFGRQGAFELRTML